MKKYRLMIVHTKTWQPEHCSTVVAKGMCSVSMLNGQNLNMNSLFN